MPKSIKVKFSGFKEDIAQYKSLILKLIKTRYNIKEVKINPQIWVNSPTLGKRNFPKNVPYKILTLSAENAFLKLSFSRYYFKPLLKIKVAILKLEKMNYTKLHFLKKIFYFPFYPYLKFKIFRDLLKKIFNYFTRKITKVFFSLILKYTKFFKFLYYLLPYYFPFLFRYLKRVANDTKKQHYAIISNDWKASNFLNFPYFFHHHYLKSEIFIKPKKFKKYKKKKFFCCFIVSADKFNPHRKLFCKTLMQYKEIHCYGKSLHNRETPKKLIEKYLHKKTELSFNDKEHQIISRQGGINENNYLDRNGLNQEIYQDYKFVICFENTIANDYITEKLPNVMLANSVGIYHGAPNIGEFFNTKSFINFNDYGNYIKMIKRIIELDQNDEQYQKVLNEPFFINNKIPPRLKNAKKDLESFLDEIFNGYKK